jgi:hypothetical protein
MKIQPSLSEWNFITFTCSYVRLSRKIAPFVFGVSIGLIVGVGFFVFKINDMFNKLRDSASDKITVIQQPVKNVVQPEEKKDTRERFRINLGKTHKVNYAEADSLIRQDDHIKIATDELLSVKNIKVIRIGDNLTANDSAAAKLADIEQSSSDIFFVEFWRTPLNSKGYRFSKNKLMLYGFVDFNNILLYELDNSYYLKASDQVYKLFMGAEFRQLERVVDSDLLAKIN